MRRRPTRRGWALLAVGALALQLGVGLGSVDLVRIGLVLLALPGVALLALWAGDHLHSRRGLHVHREVFPDPVHVDERAEVRVAVRAADRPGRARLAGLRFSEQAAVELSGGEPLRARVVRHTQEVGVRYAVHATRRGRWSLGPLVVSRTDPFGVALSRTTLGPESQLAVWPAVVALPAPSDVLVGEPDRVALGARTPSTDDANLRDYREGDDLRRVHWRSSARRGTLLVRSDERAGMRPVTVLLDLPVRDAATEWSISLAASVALAMLESGHPVRLTGAGLGTVGIRSPHVSARSGPESRAALLDLTLDLVPARTSADAEAALVAAAQEIAGTPSNGEIVLAVLGPSVGSARGVLARLADGADAWAMVRQDGRHASDQRDAHHTVTELRRAGWRATPVTVGEDLEQCWLRLLGSAR